MTTQFKLEYLQILPEFDGQRALLPEFIKISETLISTFYNSANPTDFTNILLVKAIKNKVKGEAATQIASYEVSNWTELKTALLATYADKRDLPTLTMELCNSRQGRLKPLEFFATIQENLNLQVAYIRTHSKESSVLIEFAQKLALRVFLKNLNNPLGDYLATRNPESLNAALHILTNDFNVADRVQPRDFGLRPTTQTYQTQFKPPPYTPPMNGGNTIKSKQHTHQFNRPQTNNNATRQEYRSGRPQFQNPQFRNFKKPYVPSSGVSGPTPMSISSNNTPNLNYKVRRYGTGEEINHLEDSPHVCDDEYPYLEEDDNPASMLPNAAYSADDPEADFLCVAASEKLTI